MFSRLTRSLVLALALSVLPAQAASDGSYQFTGVVTAASGDTFTVKKNDKETWTFFNEQGKPLPAVDDKVTVYYKMLAQSIETKPAKKGK